MHLNGLHYAPQGHLCRDLGAFVVGLCAFEGGLGTLLVFLLVCILF